MECDTKLRYITFKLTNRCNLKCSMCGQVYSDMRDNQEIQFEVIKDCLNNIKTLEHIYLFGGEPLLYKEFDELMKLVGEKRIPALITTNGMLLDKYAESIVKAGIRDLDISIDSHRNELYKNIRKYGDLHRVIENITTLINAKKKFHSQFPRIGISCVILPENYTELIDIYSFFYKKFPEIARITFEFPMITNESVGKETNQLYKKEFDCECNSWKWFSGKVNGFSEIQLMKIYEQLDVLEISDKVIIQGPKKEELLNKGCKSNYLKNKKCEYPYSTISIQPSGKTTFCTDFPDIEIGNVYKSKLEDIWMNENARKFRNYITTHGCFPICECCTHYHDIISQEEELQLSTKLE